MDIVSRDLSEICTPTDNYDSYLYPVGAVTDAISLLGSCFVVLIYIFLKDARNYAYLLIVQLAIANIFSSFSEFLYASDTQKADDDISATCTAQAFLAQLGITASYVWTMIISWTLYATVVRNTHNVADMFWRKMLIGYGVPLITAFIPLITGDYGAAGHWCWISIDQDSARGNIMRLVLFYVPLWLGISFNIYCYYKVIRFLRRVLPGSADTTLVNRLRLYPLILIFCWIWSTAYEILTLSDCSVDNKFLNATSLIFSNLIGLFNAIAYGLNANIQQVLAGKLKIFWKWVTKPCNPCMERIKTRRQDRTGTSMSNISDYGVEMRTAGEMSISTKNDLETSFASGNS